jgi:hypothetical protein
MWIDREHVITGGRQRGSDSTSTAASDLEDPPWRFR